MIGAGGDQADRNTLSGQPRPAGRKPGAGRIAAVLAAAMAVAVFTGFGVLIGAPVARAEASSEGAACGGAVVAAGTAAAAPDPVAPLLRPTLRLAGDGDRAAPSGALLSGIVLPAAAGPEAARALARWLGGLAGQAVAVHGASPRLDRHRRIAGQAVATGAATWIQGAVVAAGLAVADGSDGPCAVALAALEAAARQAGRGLWGSGPGRRQLVRDAGRPGGGLPDFMIAEGRVLSVGKAGATTYLNFGRRFATDLTVRVDRRTSAGFAPDNAPDGLAGRLVRVRGWATARAGVDLALPGVAALEVLEETRGDPRRE